MKPEPEPAVLHSFVVLAHGRSPFLRACLGSLREQSDRSPILVSTSTPSAFVEDAVRDYGVELRVAPPGGGMAGDWNTGLDAAATPWVTLAHQDDVYLPEYGARLKSALARYPRALLAFTGYRELTSDGPRERTLNLAVKAALLAGGFLGRESIESRWRKRALLAFGSPIPCPSVALHRERLGEFRFSRENRVNLDWVAWLSLAERAGAFVRIDEILMEHRIHEDSETTAGVSDGTREREDYQCFRTVWPKPVAAALAALYRLSYRSNRT